MGDPKTSNLAANDPRSKHEQLKDPPRRIRLENHKNPRTQNHKSAEKVMKTISVSVDDETHRLARIRAAQTETTVSAMMRDLLITLLQHPSEPKPAETKLEMRARLLDEVLERFRREGIGVDTGKIMTREELYDRNAAR